MAYLDMVLPEMRQPKEMKETLNELSQALCRFLADTYVLYVKTQYYHWNVKGPLFRELHQLFEEQYQDLALGVDDVAERIRMLGFDAPGTLTQFKQLSSIEEDVALPTANEMVFRLKVAHDVVASKARAMIPQAQSIQDEGTADLLIARLRIHEKNAWMLNSHIAEEFKTGDNRSLGI